MFDGAVNLIERSRKITLLTHKDADGDALGSILSFALALSHKNYQSYPFLSDKVSSNFLFLPGVKMLDKKFNPASDLLIFLDCADFKRGDFPGEIKKLIDRIPSILFDHHPVGDLSHYVQYKIQNSESSATAELIYNFLPELGVEIDKDIATNLLVGILTDTNSFQNSNTSQKTFEAASRLISSGARIENVSENIFYQKSYGALKLWGRAMRRIFYNKKYRILTSIIYEQDLKECGVDKDEASGIANFLNLNVSGEADTVLFLLALSDKIKGSLRTNKDNIDVSRLAKILGGGGHQKAAGFEITGELRIKS